MGHWRVQQSLSIAQPSSLGASACLGTQTAETQLGAIGQCNSLMPAGACGAGEWEAAQRLVRATGRPSPFASSAAPEPHAGPFAIRNRRSAGLDGPSRVLLLQPLARSRVRGCKVSPLHQSLARQAWPQGPAVTPVAAVQDRALLSLHPCPQWQGAGLQTRRIPHAAPPGPGTELPCAAFLPALALGGRDAGRAPGQGSACLLPHWELCVTLGPCPGSSPGGDESIQAKNTPSDTAAPRPRLFGSSSEPRAQRWSRSPAGYSSPRGPPPGGDSVSSRSSLPKAPHPARLPGRAALGAFHPAGTVQTALP